MRRTYTTYQETFADVQSAYKAGQRAAKGGFARIPQYHVKYELMWQAWLDGYDSVKEEKQNEQH